MPLRTLVRTASAVALAVPVLAGLSAISASADEVTPVAEVAAVVETADAPVAEVVSPVTDEVLRPAVQGVLPLPGTVQAAYTRW